MLLWTFEKHFTMPLLGLRTVTNTQTVIASDISVTSTALSLTTCSIKQWISLINTQTSHQTKGELSNHVNKMRPPFAGLTHHGTDKDRALTSLWVRLSQLSHLKGDIKVGFHKDAVLAASTHIHAKANGEKLKKNVLNI